MRVGSRSCLSFTLDAGIVEDKRDNRKKSTENEIPNASVSSYFRVEINVKFTLGFAFCLILHYMRYHINLVQ